MEALQKLTDYSVLLPAIGGAWVLYLISLAYYRLLLSPLAKFPGPKLAALSRWYQFYFDVCQSGQLAFHVSKLHDQYGPIVRISPEEVHIRDSDFWDDLYVRVPKSDRYQLKSDRWGNDVSIFTTLNHDVHKMRKAPLSPMFSRRAITQLQPMLRKKVDLLCSKMEGYKQSGREVNMTRAWAALAGDIITEFAFAISYNQLETPDFQTTFLEATTEIAIVSNVTMHLPWLHPILNSMPDWMVKKLNPDLAIMLRYKKDLDRVAGRIVSEKELDEKRPYPTIFYELYHSNLPPEDKTVDRFSKEALTIQGAALTTTSWSLSIATFHIIHNPKIQETLRKELIEAYPDPSSELEWLHLEKLPYLKACVQETTRLVYGTMARLPRILYQPLKYKEWTIPARTVISMTTYDVSHDEEIFPDSYTFSPDRWLGDSRAPNGQSLEHYLVSFGKGPKSCLGINLAYAELFLALGSLFRRFELELFETDMSDVTIVHDYFLALPRLDSKGIRVKVKSDKPSL